MSSDPKAPEAIEWQGGERPGGEEASEGGDEPSSVQAPSVETTFTHLVRSHSADRTPRSPVGLGFLDKYGKGRRPGGRRTPELPGESLMAVRIRKLERILGRLEPKLTTRQDRRHLAFSSLPTNILLMAQELVTVKNLLKSGVQIVGRELTRIDEQVELLDLEFQKIQESFATQVAERLGETDERQTRHEAVSSHLHEAVQGTSEQSMHRDLLLDQEIVRINEQHKRELETHELSINLVRDELQRQQESREAQDGEIAVLKALVEQLLGQVKRKGKVSDPTPEASGAGGGRRPPPPRHGAAGAPGGGWGGDPDDDGEGSGRKPDVDRKGRRDEIPAPQPEEDVYDVEYDQQFNLFSRVMANALGQRTRVPGEPPAMFRNEKHQDIRMWLMTCTDYFGRNSWQCEDEAQRIRYAISRMDGKEVAPFASTTRRQMTGEIGYTTQEGYGFWHLFAEQVRRRFGPTHEAEKSL